MNESFAPQWVPASLVRIRCFLNRRGMKVKPWLGPQVILDAFYAALHSQTKHDDFWSELERLLGDLANDMNQRIAARGWAIQNELLEPCVHAELLTQIRQALRREASVRQGLRPLATSLPARAGALLLMLAAAIVVGCGGEVDPNEAAASGGTGGATHGSSAPGSTGTGGSAMGGSSATGGARNETGGTQARLSFSLPDNPPIRKASCADPSATSGLDPAQFAACNPKLVEALIPYDVHSNSGKQLLECLCVLNDAWQAGFAELFAGQSCNSIANYFGDCGLDQLCATSPGSVPAEFDADLFVDNCSVLLYLGVRCD